MSRLIRTRRSTLNGVQRGTMTENCITSPACNKDRTGIVQSTGVRRLGWLAVLLLQPHFDLLFAFVQIENRCGCIASTAHVEDDLF